MYISLWKHTGSIFGLKYGEWWKERTFHLPAIGSWMIRGIAALVAGYGVYAFIRREIGHYMFLQNQYVFFDFEEPLIFFLADYITVIALFVWVSYYFSKGLKYNTPGKTWLIYDTCLDTNRWWVNIKRRILVIDDNLKFFQSVKKYIQNDNTDVNYMMSVKETLNVLLSGEYCLVIIYIQSITNHNTEMIRLIRKTFPLPIIDLLAHIRSASDNVYFIQNG